MSPFGGNDRSIVSVTAVGHALVHTYELSLPIFMTIWLTELATSRSELGLVVGLGYALFGAGALPGGMLTDRFGSRRLIAGCLAGMAASFALLALSSSLWAIGGCLILWGLAASVYHPAGLSLISRGAFERGYAFAYHGIAGNAGIALGPLVSALLLLVVDWQTAALLLALPAASGAIYAARIELDETAAERSQAASGTNASRAVADSDPESPNPVEPSGGSDGTSAAEHEPSSRRASTGTFGRFLDGSRALLTTAFLAVLFIATCSGLYYRGVLTFLPDLFSRFPGFDPIAIGSTTLEPGRYVYVGILMVGMAGQYVGGWLTDRTSLEWALAGSFGVLAAIAAVFLPASGAGLSIILLVSAVLGFFLFLIQPLYQALVAESSPASTRGLSYGYAYLAVFGLGAAGAGISGWIIDRYGAPELFTTLAAIAVVAALVSAWRGS